MRTITKVMMARTMFDTDAPRIQDMHATVQHILNFDAPKVHIHPLDGRRVMHALRYVDKDRLSRL
jgi:hypothetical protein